MKPIIKLGPAGVPLSAEKRDTISGIKKVAELGLQALEVEFVRGVNMSLPTAREVGKTAKKYGIELSIHAPYYINLASEKKQIIAESKKRILDSMERGAEMGAKVVAVHAGYYGKDKEEAIKMITDACEEIAGKIEKNEWNIILGIETSGKQGQFGPLEEILNICRKIRKCAPVVDFAHLFARQGGSIDYGKILEAVKRYKHLHSHFSGINYSTVAIGRGNERNHEPMGRPPFLPLAKEILKRNLDITIISESPVLEKDSLKMKKIFEELGYKFEKQVGKNIEAYVSEGMKGLSGIPLQIKLAEVDFAYRLALFSEMPDCDVLLLPMFASENRCYRFGELVDEIIYSFWPEMTKR